jgi:hypothetical protein
MFGHCTGLDQQAPRQRCSEHEIEITSGTVLTSDGSIEQDSENTEVFVLDVTARRWRKS